MLGQFSINFRPRDTVCTEDPKISGLTKLVCYFFFRLLHVHTDDKGRMTGEPRLSEYPQG